MTIFFSMTFMGMAQTFVGNGTTYSTGGNCYTLTNNTNSQNGSLWYQNLIDLHYDFDLSFNVYLGNNPSGADGMAFVLQGNNTTVQGSGGSGQGYGGIPNSIIVEYDTYINTDYQAYDPNYDHIAMMFNGEFHHYSTPSGTLAPLTNLSGGSVKDGAYHTSRVVWNAANKTLTVYFDGVQKLAYANDLVANYLNNNSQVYYGFTASTGGYSNQQSVCVNTGASNYRDIVLSPLPPPFVMRITGTNITCNGANDGTATISLSGGTPPYTINGWNNNLGNSATLTNLPAGTYMADATDATGNVVSQSITLTEPPPLNPNITLSGNPLSNILCPGGSVTLTAAPGYSYRWVKSINNVTTSNFASTQAVTVTEPGQYYAILTNGNNCTANSNTVTITASASQYPLEIAVNKTNVACNPVGGNLNVSFGGGQAPLVFLGWTDENGGVISKLTNVTNQAPGIYTASVQDACGAVVSKPVVIVPQSSPVISAGGPTTFCTGGSVTLKSGSAARTGILFNNSYVEAPANPALELTNQLTLETWFKTDYPDATQYLISKGTNDQQEGQYGIVTVNGTFQFHISHYGHQGVASNTRIQAGVWYHVAATWDGNVARIYINGVLDGSAPLSGTLTPTSSPLEIGRLGLHNQVYNIDYYTYGLMDEVRIWNVARTQQEIQDNFQHSLNLFPSIPSLVAYYRFDESKGQYATDAVNGNDGKLYNGAGFQTSDAPILYESYLWSGISSTSPGVTVSNSGTYEVAVMDYWGCNVHSNQITVVQSIPTATIITPNPGTLCPGSSITLTANPGSSYLWSNGVTTQTNTVTQSGNYTVTVTNNEGCSLTSVPYPLLFEDTETPVAGIPALPVINIATAVKITTVPTALDKCSGVINGTTTDALTYAEPGNYVINWVYKDAAGNTTIQTQDVIVTDITPPQIKCIPSMVKNTDPGVNGAIVNFDMPAVSDNVSTTQVFLTEGGGDGVISFNTKLCTAVSSLDFVSHGEFMDIAHGHGENITVDVELFNPQDNNWVRVKTLETGTGDYHFGGTSIQFPVISQVSKIRFLANKYVGAAFHFYNLEAHLNSIGLVQISGLPSGVLYPIGVTTNTFEASDKAGNKSRCSFTVTVKDNERPSIINVTGFTNEITANCSWWGNGGAFTLKDNSSAPLVLTEQYFDAKGQSFIPNLNFTLNPGNYLLGQRTFPPGVNTVLLSVKDANGNLSDTVSFKVTVLDKIAPTVVSSGNITQLADKGDCGAFVDVPQPVVSDNCTVQYVLNNYTNATKASGHYPVGTTQVLWTVKDIYGNTATTIQTITITDKEAPVINTPVDLIQTGDPGICGAKVSWSPITASDNCGILAVTTDHQSGDLFPLGTTTVIITATDLHNNTSTSSFTVTVTDNEAPTVKTKPITLTLVNGSATITAADLDNGSFDNCGSVTLWASKTKFTCDDAGLNQVTLNVTDNNGNTSGANALVTVIGGASAANIAVIPSNDVYTGGVATNMYLGYGPQSLTLKASVADGLPVTYSWSGNAVLSCTNCASPVFTPTAAGSYQFMVTATNASGCSSTATITICVRDIRVPNAPGKVYVCHTDLNTGVLQTLIVSTTNVANQLSQNPLDKLGSCDMAACGTATGTASTNPAPVNGKTQKATEEKSGTPLEMQLQVRVAPNPTASVFTFLIRTAAKAPVYLKMYDASGRLLEARNNAPVGTAFRMGEKLVSGNYYAEVIQGNERVVLKLIKQTR
ncbi:MAG: HYR domain-containing protein [Bacteroidota bacterium]|nr:HYR domain-containing protein [Bacteroidota bacterium]